MGCPDLGLAGRFWGDCALADVCSTGGLHAGLPCLCLHVILRSSATDLPAPHHVLGMQMQ